MPGPVSTEYEKRLALQPVRALLPWERMVLRALVSAGALPIRLTSPEMLDDYRVREMLDGGMGSIRFVKEQRRRGACGVAEQFYTDTDGVLVLFQLDLDDHDEPWEIDAWKVDFSPLRRPPSIDDLRLRR